MAAPKGHERWGGRKKGTPNKSTTAVKNALHEAFEKLGGVIALVEWGMDNRGEFYKLWVKTLPTEIKNADGESFQMVITEYVVHAEDSEEDRTTPDAIEVPQE